MGAEYGRALRSWNWIRIVFSGVSPSTRSRCRTYFPMLTLSQKMIIRVVCASGSFIFLCFVLRVTQQ